MSIKRAQTALEQFLLDKWVDKVIVFENEPLEADLYLEWASCTIQYGRIFRISLGSRCSRCLGMIFVNIFVKPGTGSARQVELADELVRIFKTNTIHEPGLTIEFRDIEVTKRPVDPAGWVPTQVSAQFVFDLED